MKQQKIPNSEKKKDQMCDSRGRAREVGGLG